MHGSPNLYRGNASLSTRLKIHDLHAQLAPLERYGVGGHERRHCGRRSRACAPLAAARCAALFAAARLAAAALRLFERALISPVSD